MQYNFSEENLGRVSVGVIIIMTSAGKPTLPWADSRNTQMPALIATVSQANLGD